jgi:hypothetical protein
MVIKDAKHNTVVDVGPYWTETESFKRAREQLENKGYDVSRSRIQARRAGKDQCGSPPCLDTELLEDLGDVTSAERRGGRSGLRSSGFSRPGS